MIKISQLKLNMNHTEAELLQKIAKVLRIKPMNGKYFFQYKILKQSIDARKEDVKYIYTIGVYAKNELAIFKKVNDNNVMLTKEEKYHFSPSGTEHLSHRPIVVGSGPAGLFCTYMLAQYGYAPILIERGEAVEQRMQTVSNFWKTGVLHPESNVQFGEGGAGTFSDGKLNTLVKDKQHRNDYVLETFVKFGAKEEILYVNKPHIGTDVLSNVVKNMREEIKTLGGTILFSTKLTDIVIKNNQIAGVTVQYSDERTETLDTDICVLALGHSARDTFQMLLNHKINMEPKAFAVGVRVEHLQDTINEVQYGNNKDFLPAAPYKVAKTLPNGRGVYSFCMCPGGYVVNASSESGHLAVNGMSYSKRDGKNANSAIVVSVTPEDFPDGGPLGGIAFQRQLEQQAYKEGKGNIPVQRFRDFKNNVPSKSFGSIVPQSKGNTLLANLRNSLPEFINDSLIQGIEHFGTQIPGFNHDDVILSGVESRTSSPLRILRDETFQSNIRGIYPCGEGAGYAGGITSAAMDGIKVFEAIATTVVP